MSIKKNEQKQGNGKHYAISLLESYDQISFFVLTDLDAVFNGLYWLLCVKLQVLTK